MPHLLTDLFTRQDLDAAWKLLQEASHITFLTHRNPDADGVSACAALSHYLEKKGKSVETIYPTQLQAPLKRQPSGVLVDQHMQLPDLIVICDTANYDRLYFPSEFENIPSINVDHHISNSITSTINFVVGQISSTCELMYYLMEYWDSASITSYVAECLLLGILYDTQAFRTQLTRPATLRVAAALMEKGADLYQLSVELFNNKKIEVMRFWGHLLSSITLTHDGAFAYVAVTQQQLVDYDLTDVALAGFSNFFAQHCESDITAFFYETAQGETKVSLRSKTADVNKLAAQFGGGGHKNASGIISKDPINQVVQKVVAAL